MGEHGTWFDYLNRFDWWRHLDLWAKSKLGRTSGLAMFETGWTLTHVLITITVILILLWGSLAFFKGTTQTTDKGLVPPRTMNLRNAFEYLAESSYGLVEGAMGEHNAPRFFPLIGAMFLFIMFSNLIGLVPGFVAPTDTIKTNLGLALLVFVLTHVYGVKEHGLAYFKHFLGPSPWLSPLMLPIELISHIARPLSLTVRLMGNMMADHKVVMSFFALAPLLVPIPFLLLGLLVCFIQALVFCTLAMVYIGMAIEHEDH